MVVLLKMKMELALPFFLLSVIGPTEGIFGIPDFVEWGTCPSVSLVENFDPVKYQGLWFDVKSVPNEYQKTKMCTTQNYTWQGDHISVSNRGLSADGEKVKQHTAIWPDDELNDLAEMTVIAEGVPESPYQVIATDYYNFSCVYSCLEKFGFKGEFFWLLGRHPSISPDHEQRCQQKLSEFGVDYTKMETVIQGETCPYMEKLGHILKINRALPADNDILCPSDTASWTPSAPASKAPMPGPEVTMRKIKLNEDEAAHQAGSPVRTHISNDAVTGRMCPPAPQSKSNSGFSGSSSLLFLLNPIHLLGLPLLLLMIAL